MKKEHQKIVWFIVMVIGITIVVVTTALMILEAAV